MNQFRLDLDATRCAQAHQDAHCGKMLLELTQQLCTAFPMPGNPALIRRSSSWTLRAEFITWADGTPTERLAADLLPYAHTHRNHPCAIWTRATRANFDNTTELAQALAAEYRYRKGKPHGSEAALDWVVRHRAEAQVPDGPLQPFALAMPTLYIPYLIHPIKTYELTACVNAYRAYYRAEKRGYWRKSRDPAKPSTWVPAKWTKRDPPEWF